MKISFADLLFPMVVNNIHSIVNTMEALIFEIFTLIKEMYYIVGFDVANPRVIIESCYVYNEFMCNLLILSKSFNIEMLYSIFFLYVYV